MSNHTHKEDSWNNRRVRCVSIPANFGPELLFPVLLGFNFGFTLEGETGIQLRGKVGLDMEEIMRLEGCAPAIEKLWTPSSPCLRQVELIRDGVTTEDLQISPFPPREHDPG